MALNIIGAGFGRTGTDSMRKALNILGAGPTHHMYEVGNNPTQREPWLDVVRGSQPDWNNLFEGYHACMDWPSAFYWRSLIVAYPDAKVILTMRSAESWWKSFEATILKYIQSGDDLNGFAQLLVADQVFQGNPGDRRHAIAVYDRHVDTVLATVSPERLLVHNFEDGWEPLCEWLELPVPDIDYPRGNARQEFLNV